MTRTGRIYKIIHNQSNIVYVGSTFNLLRQRWQTHKTEFKKNKSSTTIQKYFKKYGIENFKIILIKEYQVVDKYHLRAYEQLWINKLKSINKASTFGLLKDIIKKYITKKWRKENKKKMNETKKKWNNKNKSKVIISSNKYYLKNRVKIECPNCKKIMFKNSLTAHNKKYCKKQTI